MTARRHVRPIASHHAEAPSAGTSVSIGSVGADLAGATGDAYYPAFDWLRWLLASIVCLFHFDVIRIAHAGEFAVQVFFALSGWLIGGILIRADPQDLPRFFFNRGTRIWLPYALALVIFYGVAAFDRLDVWWARSLLFDGTLTHNLFECTPDCRTFVAHLPLKGTAQHFWSISAEEQFYLFAPFVILYVPRLGCSAAFWAAVAILTSVVPTNASAISFGVAAAVLAHRRPGVFATVAARAAMGAALCVLAGLLAAVGSGYAHLAPAIAVLIVLLLAVPGRRRSVGAFLGGMSYPLYLDHWIGIFAAHAVGKVVPLPRGPAVGVLSYVIALGITAVLYVVVDRTIMARRGAYFTPARGRLFMVAAIALYALGCIGGLAFNRVLYPSAIVVTAR